VLKPSSINNQVAAVHGFLELAAKRGHVSPHLVDAISYVKKPQLLPTSVLEHKEVRALLAGIDTTTILGQRDRTILELLYSAGIRRAELLGLDLRDVDLGNAVVRVMGKGQKERMVPVGRTALRFLGSYIKAVRPVWKGSNQTEALFLSARGNRLSESALRSVVDRHCSTASVRVTPHTFRRSCTTVMIRSNANLYHVKDMLGHESLETLKPYTKLTIQDLKKTHARCHPRERDEIRERGA